MNKIARLLFLLDPIANLPHNTIGTFIRADALSNSSSQKSSNSGEFFRVLINQAKTTPHLYPLWELSYGYVKKSTEPSFLTKVIFIKRGENIIEFFKNKIFQ